MVNSEVPTAIRFGDDFRYMTTKLCKINPSKLSFATMKIFLYYVQNFPVHLRFSEMLLMEGNQLWQHSSKILRPQQPDRTPLRLLKPRCNIPFYKASMEVI
jgi:hypothetical protein